MRWLASTALLPLSWLLAGSSSAQLATLDELIEQAQVKALQRDIGIRESQKQVEAPETATNSTSLLDTSSVSDLFSLALALSNLTASDQGNGGSDGTGASAAVTAYAFWSALEGFDPLDPDHYCERDSIRARRLAFTAGLDDGEDGAEDAVLAGVKFRLPIGYDVCTSTAFEGSGVVKQAMVALGAEHASLRREIVARVQRDRVVADAVAAGTLPQDPTGADVANFIDENPEANGLAAELTGELIGERTKKAKALDEAIAGEIDSLTHGNQFAVEFLTKQREHDGADAYTARLIWDHKGLLRNVDISLNAGWELEDTRSGGDHHGGMAALGLQYERPDRTFRGRRPLRAGLAAKAKWMSGEEDTYQGQLKVVVPILEGVELPISVTVSNRTELIQESEVRATFGFTFDTTNILASLRR